MSAPGIDDDEREALAVAVGRVLFDVSNFPEKAQSRLLGESMAPLRQKIVESVETAGFRRSARVPVSRDELADAIVDGSDGCCCEACSHEAALYALARFDIYKRDSA